MKFIIAIICIAMVSASVENIMRGRTPSKKMFTQQQLNGGWKTEAADIFQKQNNNLVQKAQQAVTNKFNPAATGFTFSKVLQVQTQIVSGINYSIELLYTNGSAQQIYDVVFYIVQVYIICSPWNPSADQLISCTMVSQMTNSDNTGSWQPVDQKVFQQSNNAVLQIARASVEDKYKPSAQGYKFQSVVSVQQQVVSGMNYDVELMYTNSTGGVQIYDVIVYVCPWNPSADQVAKCQLVEQFNRQ